MPFSIIRNDITKVTADAIVNTANPRPTYGNGTDQAIYRAAGVKELLAERYKIGDIARGEVAVTPAFNLSAKYIIHTVGPAWVGGVNGEFDTLASCYKKSLQKAAELECESIAFPLISTGVYGFPKDKALQIAINEISTFLLTHEMNIILVVFSPDAFVLSSKIFTDVEDLLGDYGYETRYWDEYAHSRYPEQLSDRRYSSRQFLEAAPMPCAPTMARPSFVFEEDETSEELKKLLAKKEETFQQCLLRMIDERNLKDPQVYKGANLSRQHFSKIRNNTEYKPKKTTAVAFAISLRLNMAETNELLSKAGWTIGSSTKFDIVMRYFIEKHYYDIHNINTMLFDLCGENEILGG